MYSVGKGKFNELTPCFQEKRQYRYIDTYVYTMYSVHIHSKDWEKGNKLYLWNLHYLGQEKLQYPIISRIYIIIRNFISKIIILWKIEKTVKLLKLKFHL